MLVIAIQKGWYGNRFVEKGETFTLVSKLNQKQKPTKDEVDADIKRQFSKSWMEEVPKPLKTKRLQKRQK